MSVLTIVAFTDVNTGVAYERRQGRAPAHAEVLDGAVLQWDEGASASRIRRPANLALQDPAASTFWSLVFGLTVNLRLLGQQAPPSVLERVGVPDHVLSMLRDLVVFGTWLSCLLSREPVSHLLPDGPGTVLVCSLEAAKRELERIFRP